ncbi:uncharacterized protein BX663DRAFT_554440 [Cokeromyces recurvatus]|uniref:uncharacterized protein n=1 Tax=Cokeromyces recurvatus TaxID=90255 RepID=UPI002220B7AD|nr:uncharacterized protein BX663DRAFT_554440 [Cokeromyces recurvatus]KAI7899989.1 hypothetical protein BX663DRAFT_554440 [Cokeromyces recurvatus]
MKHQEILVKTIIEYTNLLKTTKTKDISNWNVEFIKQCTNWCIYLETELSVLTEEERERIRQLAVASKEQEEIPSISVLLNAMHEFYYLLIQSIFLSNSVYLYVMKHYRFLTNTKETDILSKDLTQLSRKAATHNVLGQILKEIDHN